MLVATVHEGDNEEEESAVSSTTTTKQMLLFRRFKSRVLELPPSMGGIALGSVGLAGIIRFVSEIFLDDDYSRRVLECIAIPFYALSSIYVAILWIRIALGSVGSTLFWDELVKPPSAASYGAFVMAMGLLAEAMVITLSHEQGDGVWYFGLVGVYIVGVMQLVVMCIFLHSCWILKYPPEPLWFPPTVSVAIFALTGSTVNIPLALMEVSFWGGIILTVIILPVVLYRVLKFPDLVATNPTINILQAPVSFVAISWFAMDGSSSLDHDDAFAVVLFASSTTIFLITLYAIIRRRKYIFGVGFSGSWAAFTFPTISTLKTAVHFADRYYDGNNSNNSVVSQILRIWAIALCIVLLPCVFGVVCIYTFYALFRPKRLLGSPAVKLVDSNSEDESAPQL